MSKLARTIPVAIVVATALIAAPSGASAATQIGTTFTPGAPASGPDNTWLQVEYAAPTDGVITKWNYQAPATNVPQLKFKVARPAGGLAYTMIGESPVVVPGVSSLNSYDIRIPVQAGDIIGLYVATTGYIDRPDPAFSELLKSGDVVPPTMTTFGAPQGFMMDVSASLEPDCDADGFGDETQDQNLSSCAPPPPGTTPPPTGTPPPGSPPGTPPVTCKGLIATIVATDGSDVRTGSLGQDVIAGLGGNDTLSGLGGNDVICGGAGKDTLKGGKAKDTLLGQKGKDALNGGPSRDLCKGGKGTDTASKCEVEKSI
jgi:RTX calcium-binding nonapeptide repeat (4 copies)